MTYAELVAQIQDMLENEEADFVAAIPLFVQRAEDNIYKSVQLPVTKEVDGAVLAPGINLFTFPTDFLAPYQLGMVPSGGTFVLLENKDYEIIREIYPNEFTAGVPRYYTVFDDTRIIFAPATDVSYTYSLVYFSRPVSLVTASSNWLSTNAPNTILYGSLIEAYRFMKGDADLMGFYEKGYQMAMDNLRILAEGRLRKDTFRTPNSVAPT